VSALLIGLLIWLGFGPAFLTLMLVVRLCTREPGQPARAPVEKGEPAANDPVELNRDAA
jgi:hypothetical protein